MEPLRRARMLARLVLAWFVLSIGAAVASPAVNPQAMELVCSTGGGMKLLVKGDDGAAPVAGSHLLDCPACLPMVGPVPSIATSPERPSALAHVLRPVESARLAAVTAAPLPARGPPQL